MTKTLLIMRHAKSSWAEAGVRNFDRPLNERGLRDALRMGQFASDQGRVPDLIFSSTARRAATTAGLFIENCAGVSEMQLNRLDVLYHASPSVYLEVFARIENPEVTTAMIIGHNPGLESLVYQISGRLEPMPTAAIAVLTWEIDEWREILDFPAAKLINVWRPKEVL
jgi:phosphohistidine phosphatase